MRAAIYSRKSKFTGRGESIENQIQMCREYAEKAFGIREEELIIYEDEGFSGRNTDRPQFQRMLKDAKKKCFDMIICYRLDRISRNVSDFSRLIEDLETCNINFVSVREQFDTSKPMGRAMMYIASVFSQLERETIAERIRDNMVELAKTGRWLGGITPTGYRSEVISEKDSSGKEYKMVKLVVIPEEAELIKLIYSKYVGLKSITQVQKYLVQNRVVTKNLADYGRFSIRFILSNPVYATADRKLYEYLTANAYSVFSQAEEFNGINGLMGYNKTKQGSGNYPGRYRDADEWIIAVGMHPGIIPGYLWIETQELLKRNKSKSYRNVKSTHSLLSGIIRCQNCGSFMRPKTIKRYNADGGQVFYYICELKEKSSGKLCGISNLNGNIMDHLISNEFTRFLKSYPPIIDTVAFNEIIVREAKFALNNEFELLKEKINNFDLEINNLIKLLSVESDRQIQLSFLKQLKNINLDKEILTGRLEKLKEKNRTEDLDDRQFEKLLKSIYPPGKAGWELMSISEKRNLLKIAVDRLEWDGIKLHMLFKN